MKKILTLFVCMLCLFPILANADGPCNNYNDNRSTCLAFGGCYWDAPDDPDDPGYCNSCYGNEYHESCDITQSNCDNACHTCATGSGTTWNWDSNAPHPSNSIFDYANATLGQSSCPWICEADYYKSNNSCQQCPTNSTSTQGATDIDSCKCNVGYYMGGTNPGCIDCSNVPYLLCNATGLTYTSNELSCASGYTLTRNASTYTVTCEPTPCPNQYATRVNGTCVCIAGYYGDGTTCNECPKGTTSPQGSQNKSDCTMTSATQFCDGNGEHCMHLIPSGITIHAH